MAIEQQVIESAIEVILPIIGTGAAEGLGATASQTAVEALGAVATRLAQRARGLCTNQEPTLDELRSALSELSHDSEATKDMIVLAGAHLVTANRDLYLFQGDGPVRIGDHFDFGPLKIKGGKTHFGSNHG